MKKWVSLLLLLVSLNISAQTSNIALSEVMFYPLETNGEFVELYNLSPNLSVDLSKYQIIYSTSAADTIVAFNFGTILPPKNYAVIFENDYDFTNGVYINLASDSTLILQIDNGKFGSSGMANTSDRKIFLLNEIGDTIDTYTYSANNSAGFSDEKILVTEQNLPENWSNSNVLNGTPGFYNSISPKYYDLSISDLSVIPKEIYENSEAEFSIIIKNLGIKDASNFEVFLFVDFNHDSTAQSSEIVINRVVDLLQIGDSLEIKSNLLFPNCGNFKAFAKVIFPQDENNNNNLSETEINVLPKPNEYNDIVINEIMYSPTGEEPEWVEIYNQSDKSINLKNWKFSDRTSSVLISNEDLLIESLEYLVLTDDSILTSIYTIPSKIRTINLPSLNNTDDDLRLLNPQLITIDSVAYKSNWGGNAGTSLERVSFVENSNDFSNWKGSTSKIFATPGDINSVTPRQNDLSIASISVNPKYAIVGSSVLLSILVKNVGILLIDGFLLELYNDNNNNLTAETDELIKSISGGFIASGDSLVFSEILTEFIEGNNTIIANLNVNIDENYENNTQLISFFGIRINEVRNDIVINEIMHSPNSPEPEWIEIYNRSDKNINLKNYKIADLTDTVFVCNNDVLLTPNEYFIFADDSVFAELYPNSDSFLVANLPNLNNSGDRIILLDSLNRVIDSLNYYDYWGGVAGKSLERFDVEKPSTDSLNWASANLAFGGTPNQINSISQKDFDIELNNMIFNPNQPKFGDNIYVEVIAKNIGKQNLEFELVLSEDVFSDSTNIVNIENSSAISLNPNDSIIYKFVTQITNLTKTHSFIINAKSEKDQNVANNTILSNISPSFNFGSVLISEIMYSPINGEPEWIELFNPNAESINIRGFSISDILTTPKLTEIISEIVLPPSEFLVISKDSTIFDYHSQIPSKLLCLNFANLNNDIDGIVIRDSFGELIDSVKYKSKWGGTLGHSLERILFNKSATDSTNWKSSTDIELSTPGRKNSVTPLNFDLEISQLTTFPEMPFLEQNVFVETTIKNVGFNNADKFNVKLEYETQNGKMLLEEISFDNLLASDSLVVKSNNFFEMVDSVKIIASIDYEIDENMLNNSISKAIISGIMRNSVIINEFVANPNVDEAEWIELFNNSNKAIDVSNWFVSDLLTTPKPCKISENSVFIKPNEYLIITNDTSKLFLEKVPTFEVKFGTLGNIEDGIVVYDYYQNIVDSLKYNADWEIQKGRSLERFSINQNTTDISNWLPSLAVSGSSPGNSNSVLNTIEAEQNSIIINEIMFDPELGKTEFIELFNITKDEINIGGWKLIINESDFFEISSPFLTLKSGEYFVIASDSLILTYNNLNLNNTKILTESTLSLSNVGERVVVVDHWGNLIDSLFYNPKWHNKNIATTKNKSLERISPNIESNEATNWSTSVDKFGATPGAVNSIFAQNTNIPKGISFSPNPFSPDNDGFEDFTIINYSIPFNTAQIRVKIFDDHGRLVRTLLNNKAISQSGSIIFDGLNDVGNPLKIGMYIVFMEVVDNNSAKVISYKDVIVVARRL